MVELDNWQNIARIFKVNHYRKGVILATSPPLLYLVGLKMILTLHRDDSRAQE